MRPKPGADDGVMVTLEFVPKNLLGSMTAMSAMCVDIKTERGFALFLFLAARRKEEFFILRRRKKSLPIFRNP
jgi:hypothetical protein